MHNDDETVDLLGYLSRLKHFWLPALVVGLVVMVAVGALGWKSSSAATIHHTKAHVMVQPPVTTNAAAADTSVQMMPQIMRSFIALEDVPVLTNAISKELKGRFTPEQVASMTSIYWGGGSMLLAMQAQAPNEQDALDLSNAAADALVAHASEIVKLPADEMPRVVKVQDAIDDPMFPTTSASSSHTTTIAEAVAGGVVAALVVAFVLEWVSASRRRRTSATTAR